MKDFKELLDASGMKMSKFSKYFKIPYRSVQNWQSGERKCPEYLLELIEYKLIKENIIQVKEKMNMKKNTIRLIKGETRVSKRDFENYEKYSMFDIEPEELKRWSIEEEQEAKKELEKYRCSYQEGPELVYIEEYALEYFTADEDGEFIEGSDYDVAADAE